MKTIDKPVKATVPADGRVETGSPPRSKGPLLAFASWLFRSLPTLMIIAGLAGLAYWGHHTGWAMPTFNKLTGQVEPEPEGWCEEHSVPEDECVECNGGQCNGQPIERPKDYGWCNEHGVHNCPLCHPDVAQLPEVPVITEADRERARRGLMVRPRPENNRRCPMYKRLVQFASIEAMTKAGVEVALAEERPLTEYIKAPGEIVYDQTRVARLASRASGTVWWVGKEVGDPVAAGDLLALVDAVDVGKAKADFLQAYVQLELKRQALNNARKAGDALAGQRIQEAEAAFRAAKVRLFSARQALVNLGLPIDVTDLDKLTEEELVTRLQFLGLPHGLTTTLDPTTTTANLLPVRAPFDGIVVERKVVNGEVVDPNWTLFVVADVKQMWLTLDVRQEDIKYVSLGQEVEFQGDGDGIEAKGTISWISTSADEKTRTVMVRADVANPDGRLQAFTFGTGRIVLRREPRAVVVPTEAVQWDGSCHVVFVRDKNFFKEGSPKLFHTRTVRPGPRDGKYTEIIAGVLPGEVVAAEGSGVLRAEILKNNLGAG